MKIKKVLLFIYLFYILYMPRFFKSDSVLLSNYVISIIISSFIILIYILINKRTFFKMLLNKKVALLIFGILMASFYYFIRALIAGITDIKELRIIQSLATISFIVHALFFVYKLENEGYNRVDAIGFIIKVVALQGAVCLIMLIIPSTKQIANTLYLNNVSKFTEESYILKTRIYGISSDYTFGMPIIQGISSGICMKLALEDNKKYFKYFPLVFIGALLNGRTGLLLAIITTTISIVYYAFKYNNVFKFLKYCLIGIISIAIIFNIISIFNNYVIVFSRALYKELTILVIEGETTGTTDYLLSSHFFLPNGIGLIFGEGYRVFAGGANTLGYSTSDVGYVNDIFMGGLIYAVLLYGTYFKFICVKIKQKGTAIIKLLIIISFIIANLKGQALLNSTYVFYVLYISICCMFLNDENSEKTLEKNLSIERE